MDSVLPQCNGLDYDNRASSGTASMSIGMNMAGSSHRFGRLVIASIGCLLLSSVSHLAVAGCRITTTYSNTGDLATNVVTYRKTRGGSWKKVLYTDEDQVSIAAGASVSLVSQTVSRCNAKRRYRFQIKDSSRNTWFEYYPGSSSWTTTTTFAVDINRH